MTETPRERNRRTNRSTKPEDIAPATQSRARQARVPIGRSQELLERQEQLRQSQRTNAAQPVRTQRQLPAYSDFDQTDFSARAAQPVRLCCHPRFPVPPADGAVWSLSPLL